MLRQVQVLMTQVSYMRKLPNSLELLLLILLLLFQTSIYDLIDVVCD